MSLANIYKTLCDGLGLSAVNGSYVQALGDYFGVVDVPGKRYEDEVLVKALINSGGPGTSEVLIFDTFTDFPFTGEDTSLYVTKDSNIIYRYDSGLNNYVLLNDPNVVDPDAPEEGQTFYVRLATSGRLNACTYNNGTAGVGATLTGNVNGQLGEVTFAQPRIDTVAAVQGDVILVKNQTSAIQNGIYEVTQLGDAGNPFILTRIDGYDQASEVYPSIVFVSAGNNNINRYFTQGTANPTIGTSNLVYGVATTTQPVSPLLFYDTVTATALSACTYTSGTTYPTLPGWGATLTADANGALGVINGVTMTSGMRLIVKDQSNGAHNGVYTVTNAGSATQRWVLTRQISDTGQWYRSREFTVTNPSCNQYGSRWSVSSPLSMSNLNYGITPIVFSQKNSDGLIDSNGDVNISANGNLNLAGNNYVEINNNVNNQAIIMSDFGINIEAATYPVSITSANSTVSVYGEGDVQVVSNGNNVNIFAESGEFNIYAGQSTDWYVGDTDQNKGYIKRTAGVGIANEVKIHAALGKINLSSGYLVASQLPSYVDDAAADADSDLPSGAFYKLNAGRAIYQKP